RSRAPSTSWRTDARSVAAAWSRSARMSAYASKRWLRMNSFEPNLISIIAVVATIGLMPLAVVTMTGFLKISVVLFLIRNALVAQQAPPNLVLYGIPLILPVYATPPLIGEVYGRLVTRAADLQSAAGMRDAAEAVREPLQSYLARFTHQRERDFFVQATKN